MDSSQKFKWALLVVDCMKGLRDDGFPFVDQEVIPNFDETAHGISAWFICRDDNARERFALPRATKALKNKLRSAGFPQDAVETLQTRVTSQTEIEAGGGRFYFFR